MKGDKVIGFVKDGIIYEKCKHCDKKYLSTSTHILHNGEWIGSSVHGTKKELKKKGYKPIYA